LSAKLVPEMCAGCTRRHRNKNSCHAINEPRYFYKRYGECFAYTTDPDWYSKCVDAVAEYEGRRAVDERGSKTR